jgi:hypothetical protein
MKKFLYAVLCAMLFFCLSVNAQAPMRVEIEAKHTSDDYVIIPIGEEGLLQFNETKEKAKDKNRVWSFVKYDTDFKEVWSKDINVLKNVEYISFVLKNGHVYLLMADKVTGEISFIRNDYEVIDIDLKTGKNEITAGKLPQRLIYSGFSVEGKTAMFGGTSIPSSGQILFRSCVSYAACLIPVCFGYMDIKRHPILVKVDLKTKKGMVMATNYKGTAGILDIGCNDADKTLNTLFYNRPSKKVNKVFLKEYNEEATESNQYEIDPEGENMLLNGRLLSSKTAGEKFLAGTFSLPKKEGIIVKLKKAMAPNSYQPTPSGIYITKLNGVSQEYIEYYKFSQLKNFFKFLGGKTEKKAKEKVEKREKRGKSEGINYRFIFHDAINHNGQKVIVAEAYYPEYHYEYYIDANGKASSRRVFDGFRYTHALVLGFDTKGELLWDNCFEIADILTMNLKERVKIMPLGDDVMLAYAVGGYIKSKIIRENDVVDGKTSTKIESEFLNDKVKANYNSDMSFWYDNYFLASGFQKIKNKDGKKVVDKKKRTVFYFNKIVFN